MDSVSEYVCIKVWGVGTSVGTVTAPADVPQSLPGYAPTIFSFTTTWVSFSCSSKAVAFWAAFTRLSEAVTALLAALAERESRQCEMRNWEGSQLTRPPPPRRKHVSGTVESSSAQGT